MPPTWQNGMCCPHLITEHICLFFLPAHQSQFSQLQHPSPSSTPQQLDVCPFCKPCLLHWWGEHWHLWQFLSQPCHWPIGPRWLLSIYWVSTFNHGQLLHLGWQPYSNPSWLQCGHKCYSHCICSAFRVAEEANFTGRDETTSWTQQQNGNDGGPGAFHRHLQVSFEKESSSEDYLPRSCTMVIPSDLIADLLEVDKNQNLGRLGNSVTGLPENSGKLSSLKEWALKPGGGIIDGLI